METLAGDRDLDPLRTPQRLLQVRLRQDGEELVPAVAGQNVGLAAGAAEDSGDAFEHVIARRMAVGVVEQLEVVQVHHHQGHRLAGAAVARQFRVEPLVGAAVIAQAGQRIAVRQAARLAEQPDSAQRPTDVAADGGEDDPVRFAEAALPPGHQEVAEVLPLPAHGNDQAARGPPVVRLAGDVQGGLQDPAVLPGAAPNRIQQFLAAIRIREAALLHQRHLGVVLGSGQPDRAQVRPEGGGQALEGGPQGAADVRGGVERGDHLAHHRKLASAALHLHLQAQDLAELPAEHRAQQQHPHDGGCGGPHVRPIDGEEEEAVRHAGQDHRTNERQRPPDHGTFRGRS